MYVISLRCSHTFEYFTALEIYFFIREYMLRVIIIMHVYTYFCTIDAFLKFNSVVMRSRGFISSSYVIFLSFATYIFFIMVHMTEFKVMQTIYHEHAQSHKQYPMIVFNPSFLDSCYTIISVNPPENEYVFPSSLF